MATHLLLCLCRRNTEWGMHLLPSQAGCNTLLSRSSPRRREFCVLPLGPNPHSCLSVSQVAHLDSHRTPLLWVQQGGEARQLQHRHTQTTAIFRRFVLFFSRIQLHYPHKHLSAIISGLQRWNILKGLLHCVRYVHGMSLGLGFRNYCAVLVNKKPFFLSSHGHKLAINKQVA